MESIYFSPANRVALTIASDGIVASFLNRLPETKATPLCKILLMILFSSVKFLSRQDLSNNIPVQYLLLSVSRF